jgi:intraflagellar transport protein 80
MVTMSLKFDHLVVITTTQALFYRHGSWSAPATVDLKAPVTLVQQAKACVVLVDRAGGVSVYNYDGRLVSTPKLNGLGATVISELLTVNDETMVIRDPK